MDIRTDESSTAKMWGSTGIAYDGISFGLSDTIFHCVQMLWPLQGETVLDIGTGTGWAARLAAARGARVTGIDISSGMLAAARTLSESLNPPPDFRLAPAEKLPVEDASVDGILSTYGVIFSQSPAAAIVEMARVLKPAGRLALATWADESDGYIPQFFRLIAGFSEAPPPPVSPFDWGRPGWLEEALSDHFRIGYRRQTTVLYAPDPETVWKEYLRGFGPVAATYEALGQDRRAAFREAFLEIHRGYETPVGLVIPRQALLVKGRRR